MRLDGILRVCCIAAAFFLTFVAGGFATFSGKFPYGWLQDATVAYMAIKERSTLLRTPVGAPKKSTQNTVVRRSGAYEGYTLYTQDMTPGAMLIDMDGREVYQWKRFFSKTWLHAPQVKSQLPDSRIGWADVHLYPNGDMLVVHQAFGDTPYGYGLERIDKHSDSLWHYDENVNHRLNVNKDGTIYALIQQIKPAPDFPGIPFSNREIFYDSVVKLTPDGKEMARVPLIEAFAHSPYKNILKNRVSKEIHKGNVLHPNSVIMLTEEMAKAFPMFKPGQVLVSMRNINTIGVLDMNTGIFVWAKQGIWKMQHDAEFVSDGSIMIFDNRGSEEEHSRIVKYYPATDKTKILFEGSKEHPFFSRVRGMQQLLPSGNLLITASTQGKVFEITPKGEVVWRFTNPYQRDNRPIPVLNGIRFTREELPFLKGVLP